MDTKEIFEILGVFLLSTIKFGLAGVPTAVFAKFSFFKAITVTSCGGFMGTIVFTYLSGWLIRQSKKIREKYFGEANKKSAKQFTRTNKIIVTVKRKFGLTGISIITPLVLSIPLGCFIAVRYFSDKKKIITYMFVSIFIQSIVLFLFYHSFYKLIF